MFRLASCNDYVALKRKYQDLYAPHYGAEWTLKEFGSLLVYDFMQRQGVDRALEFGPGFNLFFSNIAKTEGIDYWCIDRPSTGLGIGADDARYREAVAARLRNGTMMLDGLLGEADNDLPDEYFDLVFSISVVEHIAPADMRRAVDEGQRVLRSGGELLNTIDIYHGSTQHRNWHGACRDAGLAVPEPHGLDWQFSGERTTFLERQDVRYLIYNSLNTDDVWAADLPYVSQFATAVHLAIRN